MKFSCSVNINLPLTKVIELYDNPDNMRHWQDGFVSFSHSSGNPGTPGATAVVKYKNVELLETIIERNPPTTFHSSYEGSWGKNTMYSYFEETAANQTRWRSELEYVEMNGLVMKIMKTLMPGMFRKQTQKWMDQFKVFAENQ